MSWRYFYRCPLPVVEWDVLLSLVSGMVNDQQAHRRRSAVFTSKELVYVQALLRVVHGPCCSCQINKLSQLRQSAQIEQGCFYVNGRE